MSQFGVSVTTDEQLQAGAGVPVNTGTAFFAGACDQGPPPSSGVSYIKCQSLNDYITAFGVRSATSASLYDTLDAFFQEQGSLAYVTRVTDNTATSAALTLNDSGSRPTVTITAATPGTAGNAVYIVVTVASSRFTVTVQDAAGDVLETHGPYSATSALFADTTSTLVTFAQSTAAGNTTNNPVASAAAPLTGGADANDLTDASYVSALANFPGSLGPGTVAIPGKASSTIWSGLLAHAQSTNRFAALDVADSSVAATVISSIGSIGTASNASYGAFTSGSCTIPGITPGTTRMVAGSAIFAALRAQVAATGNDNQAPAGINWPLRYVTGLTNVFNTADRASLIAAGINPWAIRFGVPCLYGTVTPVSPSADAIFWQFAPACERMAFVADATEIMESYLFDVLDGQGHTITAAQGALQGLIADHWRAGALYGRTVTDAGSVLVGAPINTASTAQAAQLNANAQIRISPTAQAINLTITSVPVTQTVVPA